jgi:TMEM199 family protein
MVLLTTTPYIHTTLSALPNSILSSLPSIATPPQVGSPIDHHTLIALTHLLKTPSAPPALRRCTLSTLLRGTSVDTPPPPPPPQPTPEYLALKQRLLEQQEQREYAALINKSSTMLTDAENEAENARDDVTPSLVFNILLSVLLCAGATFYITRFWSNDGIRVLVSLLVGIVVGVAEVTVYAGYLRKVERSRRLENKKREVKVMLGEYTGENEVSIERVDLTVGGKRDAEEIWGRGVNGGMRRRVREKWEKEQRRKGDQGLSSLYDVYSLK